MITDHLLAIETFIQSLFQTDFYKDKSCKDQIKHTIQATEIGF